MRGFLTYLLFSRPNNDIIWWVHFLARCARIFLLIYCWRHQIISLFRGLICAVFFNTYCFRDQIISLFDGLTSFQMCTDFLTYLLLPAPNNIIISWTNMRGFLTYLLFLRPNNIIIWWVHFLARCARIFLLIYCCRHQIIYYMMGLRNSNKTHPMVTISHVYCHCCRQTIRNLKGTNSCHPCISPPHVLRPFVSWMVSGLANTPAAPRQF